MYMCSFKTFYSQTQLKTFLNKRKATIKVSQWLGKYILNSNNTLWYKFLKTRASSWSIPFFIKYILQKPQSFSSSLSSQVSEVLCSRVSRRCCVRFVGYVCCGAYVWSVGWGDIYRTVPGAGIRVHRWSWVAWISIRLLLRRTRCGKDNSSDQKNSSRGPADVDGSSNLPPLCFDG